MQEVLVVGMQQRGKLKSLAGLRFFAAFAIFYIHVGYFIPPLAILQSAVAKACLPACSAGVCLFFLLSGFLLAYTHADISLTNSSLYTFWTSRIARVYPVYFLALVLYAPFILAHRFLTEPAVLAVEKALESLLPSILLIQSWGHPRLAIAWNGPGWSLSVEAALYLAFPWMAYWLGKLSQRALQWMIALFLLMSFTLSISVPRLLTNWPYADLLVNFNPLFHLPTFGIGIALGCFFLRSNAAQAKTRWLAVWGILSIAVMAVIAPIVSPNVAHNSLFVLPFAALIYGLACGGKLSGFFAKPLFILLGEASYSFYILQFPLGLSFRWLNEGRPRSDLVAALPGAGILSGLWAATACTVLLLGMSIFIYRYFEVPFRRFLLTYMQRGRLETSSPLHLPLSRVGL